jgi:uncharacterized repeat protein (TIGR01451 family)
MIGKKVLKILIVWLCIITLVMPFGTEVLAAVLTTESTSTVLESIPYREGGSESTGLVSDSYDTASYAYTVEGINVLKVVQKGDSSYSDTFYCVNAGLSLSITDSYNYKKVSDDFTVISDKEVKAWADSVGISTSNYNALIYLLNNIYLKKQNTSYKDAYIAKAFASLIAEQSTENNYAKPVTVDTIKSTLTDDDIDVVQQWAIWYFTNGSNSENEYYNAKYQAMGSIQVSHMEIETVSDGETPKVVTKTEDLSTLRVKYAGMLFDYLVKSAKEASETSKTYPTIDKTTSVTSIVDGDYYKVGPFKVNSGNTISSDFVAEITTVGGSLNDVAYKIFEDGVDVTSSFTSISLDKEYYIYLPIENNTITSVKLSTSYTDNSRNISLWKGESDTQTLQPLVLILEQPKTVQDSVTGTVDQKSYDLALRKFVVSINGDSQEGRTPVVTTDSLQKLASGEIKTAEYTHSKSPLAVKKGDKVVFEFRIYNEGDLDAKVQKIVDYLPAGLTVVDKANSTVNSKYNWEVNGTTVTCSYLSDTTIKAFDKTTLELNYGVIQLECEVTGDLTEGTTLTNVAEIITDNGSDRDSETGSINKDTITENFTGNTSNKEDLSDKDYYYKGLEDDDDFEKLVIEGDQFDLSLQKFVSKVNDEAQSREPKVDVTPLNNGKDDATYTTTKTPVNVETGDVITFTIRVYNEGDISGYAEQITDYIPEGLGFLVNYSTNYDNKWAISEDLATGSVMKLTDIKNAKDNLKVSDFIDVSSLDEVSVVLGKTKVTSTALASSTTSDANLIKAFDGTTLSYKDVQITCIVVTEDELTLKNIAAITKEADEDKNPVDTDRGSTSKDSTPKDDINPDNYTTGNEDDDDYDVVKTDKKDFDLALQKFITGLNDTKVTDRTPIVSVADGKIKYTHSSSEALSVGNGDLVTYTIRVYNEGEIDGYATEIADDIPTGLVFVTDNETNKNYGWKMYDKSGNETTDVNQAVRVKTTYLSKEVSDNNLIKAYDGTTLSYKDVQLVFKVDETLINKTVTTSERTLTNTAEITKCTDSDGNVIPDIDSTPDNNDLTEDDIDQEKVYVKYFDLALEKNLTKALVTVDNKTTEVAADNNDIKIEIQKKKLNSTSIQFVYNITVRNEGEIEGYATEIKDYIPDGLSFNSSSNPDWEVISGNMIKTNALAKQLLQPGQTATVQVVLDWNRSSDNIGKFVNVAEISEDWNSYNSDDVDSIPDNLVATEDDYDDAPVWVGIVTGIADQPYILLTSVVLVILGTGIFLIKKYVL